MTTEDERQQSRHISDEELVMMVKASAEKAHSIIQRARTKMTPEEREQADNRARMILQHASDVVRKARRHS
jgi:hypothetical protein